VVQRQLAADEAHFLREVRARAGRVEGELIAHWAAEQRVHRLAAHLGEQVPQRQVNAGDGVDNDALRP